MKRTLPILAVVFLAGCLDVLGPSSGGDPPSISVTQTVTQTVYPPPEQTPTPDPEGEALCPAAASVELSAVGQTLPSSLSVGDVVRLDATPKDIQGQDRTDQCNELRGVLFETSGPCSLDNPTSFTPNLTATGVGTCTVVVSVEDVGSAATIQVQ